MTFAVFRVMVSNVSSNCLYHLKPNFEANLTQTFPLHKQTTQNWKSKKLSFNSCCITCFHIMAVNVSAIIRVTPQTRVFTFKKKIPKTNQGSSNAQKKYILKHKHTRRKIDHICWSYCDPPATSWSMSGGQRCLFGLPESSLSLSPSVSFWSPWLDWQTCCS